MQHVETKTCAYCGKSFLKSTKNKCRRLPPGVLSKRRVTCSSECSKEYAYERRIESRIKKSIKKDLII